MMRLLRRIAGSKPGLWLFVVHSTFAIYGVASKPPTDNRQELIDCRTTALAGRAIQLGSEPVLLRTLGWLDLPALTLYYMAWTLFYAFADHFHISVSLYTLSWIS